MPDPNAFIKDAVDALKEWTAERSKTAGMVVRQPQPSNAFIAGYRMAAKKYAPKELADAFIDPDQFSDPIVDDQKEIAAIDSDADLGTDTETDDEAETAAHSEPVKRRGRPPKVQG